LSEILIGPVLVRKVMPWRLSCKIWTRNSAVVVALTSRIATLKRRPE